MSQDLNLRPAAEIIDDMFAPYRKRIATLEAENAELRRDAERYRWISRADNFKVDRMLSDAEDKRQLDAAIDAAMAGE